MPKILLVTSRVQLEACEKEFKKASLDITVINCGGQITELDERNPIEIKENGELIEHWSLRDKKSSLLEYLERFYGRDNSFVLAADGSIESEKIAFDLSELLLGEKIEISVLSSLKSDAIVSSMKSSRPIDNNRARAASVRSVIDALIGIRLSRVMRWHLKAQGYRIPDKLSIGRIMAPSLKILCDNKRDIDTHISEPYARLKCWYRKGDARFEIVDKTRFFTDAYDHTQQLKDLHNKLLSNPHVVTNYYKKQREESPPEPLYLSLLEIAAFNAYRYNSQNVAKLAEDLYLLGYISNFRTNSNKISEESFEALIAYLYDTIAEDEVVDIQRRWKEREGAQFDEYAIVPTSFSYEVSPGEIKNLWKKRGERTLTKVHHEIYELIWHRTLSTQMESAFFDATEIHIQVLDHKMKMVANKPLVEINEEGEEVERLGWLSLNKVLLRKSITLSEDGYRDDMEDVLIPEHEIGEEMVRVDVTQNHTGTQPPKRYGESRFIKTLERLRISQPGSLSLLTQKMSNLGLIEFKGIVIHVKALGVRLSHWVEKYASFLNDIEEVVKVSHELKQIENGEHPDPDNLIRDILYLIQQTEASLEYDPDRSLEKPSSFDIQKARMIAKKKGVVIGEGLYEDKEKLDVFLRNHGEYKGEPQLIKPVEKLGKCPLCKSGAIVRKEKFYSCDAFKKSGCGFGLNIEFSLKFLERFGIESVSESYLDSIVQTTLSKPFSEVNNMVNSDGKTFVGKVSLVAKNNFWNLGFYKKE